MNLLIGYIPAGPREALRTTRAWADTLSRYLADPVVAEANASPLKDHGMSVIDMLAHGIGRIEDKVRVFAFQYALYTMIARIMLIKLKASDIRLIGYSGGIQPALIAAGIFEANAVPADIVNLNRRIAETAIENRANGISACTVDFTDAGWAEANLVSIIERKYKGAIFVQDRRSATVIDFAGGREAMKDFLATLDKRASMAVRASLLRADGGYHTPLIWRPDTILLEATDAWTRAYQRFANTTIRVGSSIGCWWPRELSPQSLREFVFATHTIPMESGRMASLLRERDTFFIGSRMVLQEMFAGTNYRALSEHIVDVSWF